MNQPQEIDKSAIAKINADFELELPEDAMEHKDFYKEYIQYLAGKIAELIDHDFEKLLWILYRVDVNENKVRETLAENSLTGGPEILAELIVQRQLEKAATRKAFSTQRPADDDELRL